MQALCILSSFSIKSQTTTDFLYRFSDSAILDMSSMRKAL